MKLKQLKNCIVIGDANKGNQLVIHEDYFSYNGEVIEHPDTKAVFRALYKYLDDCGYEVSGHDE